MILWANLHGSFTFGLALLYVFAGYSCCERLVRRSYGRCRRTLYVVVAVTICALITPYGIYSALLTLETTKLKFAFNILMSGIHLTFNKIQFIYFYSLAF